MESNWPPAIPHEEPGTQLFYRGEGVWPGRVRPIDFFRPIPFSWISFTGLDCEQVGPDEWDEPEGYEF